MNNKLSVGGIFIGSVLIAMLIGCATIMGKSSPER